MELPLWVPAGEAKPAPGPLLLVQAFVNTWDADRGTDTLTDVDAASQWLRECGLLTATAQARQAELRAAREVREAIRHLIGTSSNGALDDADARALARVAGASRLTVSISPAGQVGVASQGSGSLADGLAGLLLIIRDAQRDGTWPRLKVCGNSECCWAFYDRSHSRRGAWCDMAGCGNMIKNRNLRARLRAADVSQPPI